MNRKKKGMTLIEVIVTIAIFGLVMSLFVGIINTSLSIQRKSNEITRVNNTAAEKIEARTGTSTSGTISVTFSGVSPTVTFSANGNYYTGGVVGATYKGFKPSTWMY